MLVGSKSGRSMICFKVQFAYGMLLSSEDMCPNDNWWGGGKRFKKQKKKKEAKIQCLVILVFQIRHEKRFGGSRFKKDMTFEVKDNTMSESKLPTYMTKNFGQFADDFAQRNESVGARYEQVREKQKQLKEWEKAMSSETKACKELINFKMRQLSCVINDTQSKLRTHLLKEKNEKLAYYKNRLQHLRSQVKKEQNEDPVSKKKKNKKTKQRVKRSTDDKFTNAIAKYGTCMYDNKIKSKRLSVIEKSAFSITVAWGSNSKSAKKNKNIAVDDDVVIEYMQLDFENYGKKSEEKWTEVSLTAREKSSRFCCVDHLHEDTVYVFRLKGQHHFNPCVAVVCRTSL
ncbi:hypothetical protein RFI_24993 [Reticulomyxa filosa]|uniref:Uncharacterized protein n=1 Tax=Reticulomyxa filosa TaxID=46433 RepID=X6MEH1_RETFI|nr:hypothetical protein RFI_24993 [Reticulomyxa filosa]|eukprot:ETO12383.1 hypothetical protein RFI_24993 [Reticulomyxa filosa]